MENKLITNVEFTPDQKLMALSWKEPFASLMLKGKIETRMWNTNYRGWVLICASLQRYDNSQLFTISGAVQMGRIIETLGYDFHKNKNCGKAIAIGRLIDCRPMKFEDEDLCFVEYQKGLFVHIYDNVRAIKQFNWKGSQGWRQVGAEKTMIEFIN